MRGASSVLFGASALQLHRRKLVPSGGSDQLDYVNRLKGKTNTSLPRLKRTGLRERSPAGAAEAGGILCSSAPEGLRSFSLGWRHQGVEGRLFPFSVNR